MPLLYFWVIKQGRHDAIVNFVDKCGMKKSRISGTTCMFYGMYKVLLFIDAM